MGCWAKDHDKQTKVIILDPEGFPGGMKLVVDYVPQSI